MDGKDGNGGYFRYRSSQNKEWFLRVGEPDVRLLYGCYTKAMFVTMSLLIKQAWLQDGEERLWLVFSDSYIYNSPFNNWYFSCSGIPGCVPDNNPTENCNLDLKGHASMEGVVSMRRGFQETVQVELPKMIHNHSSLRICPRREFPVLNINNALSNECFMQYYALFDWTVDCCTSDHSLLVNSEHRLSQPITPERIQTMRNSLNGVFEDDFTKRSDMVQSCKDIHIVRYTQIPETNGNHHHLGMMCVCNCVQFFEQQYCYQSLIVQHRSELVLRGTKIAGGSTKKKKTKKELERMNMMVALDSRRKYKKTTKEIERHTKTNNDLQKMIQEKEQELQDI